MSEADTEVVPCEPYYLDDGSINPQYDVQQQQLREREQDQIHQRELVWKINLLQENAKNAQKVKKLEEELHS